MFTGKCFEVAFGFARRYMGTKTNTSSSHARLVLNHSTFVDGLRSVLNKLVHMKEIKTITPGRISKRARRSRTDSLMLKLCSSSPRSLSDGSKRVSFMLLASRGNSIQEIYLVPRHEHKDIAREVVLKSMRAQVPYGVLIEGKKGDEESKDGEDDDEDWGL